MNTISRFTVFLFLAMLSCHQAVAQQDSLSLLEKLAQNGTIANADWMRLARARRDAHNPAGALEAARKAVQLEPRSDDAQICLATMLAANNACAEAREGIKRVADDTRKPTFALLLAQGEIALACDAPETALVPLLGAYEMAPSPAIARLLGDTYARIGVNELAIRYYTECLPAYPGEAALHERLAGCYLKEQKYGDAAREYEEALKYDSTSAQSLLMLGKLMFAAKRYDRCADLLARYLRIVPGNRDIESLHLDALKIGGKNQEAYNTALRILNSDSSNVHARQVAANAAFQLAQYNDARAQLLRLDAAGQISCEELFVMARCERALRLDSLSIQTYRRVIDCDSTSEGAISELGSQLMRSRRYDEAIAMYTRLAQQDPTAAAPLVNLSLSAMALGRWNDAEMHLRNAIQRKPDHLQAHVHLGRVLIELDSADGAFKEFSTAIALYDSTSGKNRDDVAEAHALSGWLSMQSKKSTAALSAFDQSLRLRPNHITTLLWKGQTLATAGKKSEAVATFKAVLALDPENADAKRGLQMK